jgi:multisubunit Na+/H+ antiporter MnhG subunit
MNDAHDPGHGSSPAAWTGTIIMLIGMSAGTLFFWLDQAPLVWASASLLVIGPLVGTIMAKAGYGVGGSKTKASD